MNKAVAVAISRTHDVTVIYYKVVARYITASGAVPRPWAEEVGEGAGGAWPPSSTSGGHPCYWPLLENAKSASSLATLLGRD